MIICFFNGCDRIAWTNAKMLLTRRGRLKLTLLFLIGLCFSVSQTSEEMLEQVVGESITFPFPVMEGGSLSYNTYTIAVVFKGNMDSNYRAGFKDRIQWDQETGLFTIRDLKTNDSGIYNVDGKKEIRPSYQLTVYDPVSSPMLTSAGNGSCSVECFVKNDIDVTLSWYRGEEILNQTSSSDLSINLFLPLDEEVKDRDIYRCEATNPVTKETVMFQVPGYCAESKAQGFDGRTRGAVIIAVICVLVALGLVILLLFCLKKKKKKKRNGHSQDPSEREQSSTCYAEILHVKPTDFQEERIDLPERNQIRETTQLTSIYDKLQFERVKNSVVVTMQ
ncbi:hypothetical protein UPYG_G00041980 [Umbra pygmaea]|uniref:Ig-like domain-containing protein n=1 Tax=Umbra pygmaea TaxID=75934 RepID=A0ABD0Y8Z6_UMBPY